MGVRSPKPIYRMVEEVHGRNESDQTASCSLGQTTPTQRADLTCRGEGTWGQLQGLTDAARRFWVGGGSRHGTDGQGPH